MTLEQLYNKLLNTSYDVAYSQFKTPPQPPFIAYYVESEMYRGADLKNNIREQTIAVDLYCDNKNFKAEKKIEDILSFTKFEKENLYINKEKLYLTRYSFSTTEKI